MVRPNQSRFEKPHPGITGRFAVDGEVAGAIIAVGFVVMGLIGIPEARPFIVGTALLGGLLGLILWWKHNRSDS